MKLRCFGALLCVVTLCSGGLGAQRVAATSDPGRFQIHLMTMGPGSLVYERFSHNAIWVRDRLNGVDKVYNFGIFDFNASGFVTRFIKGEPEYILAAFSLDATIEQYTRDRRSIDVQELALSPAQAAELVFLLEQNALPENRAYRYDYYFDNCSTRIRDLLDQVLGGALREATERVPVESTFRSHTQRLVANDPLMYLGILLVMGPRVDKQLDQWAEMFLPQKLADRVGELTVDVNGTTVPLVRAEQSILSFNEYQVLESKPDWTVGFLLSGLGLAGLIALGLLKGPIGTFGRVVGGSWALVSGVAGIGVLYIAGFSHHLMAAGNHNLSLVSPLSFVLIPILWGKRFGAGKIISKLVLALAAIVVIGSLLAVSAAIGGQVNREVAALVSLPTLMACYVARRLSRFRPVVQIPTT